MKVTTPLQGYHLSIWGSWLKRQVQEMPFSFIYYYKQMHKHRFVIRNCYRLLHFKIHNPFYKPSNRNSKVEKWQHSCPHVSCKEVSYDSRCYGGVTSFTYSNYTTQCKEPPKGLEAKKNRGFSAMCITLKKSMACTKERQHFLSVHWSKTLLDAVVNWMGDHLGKIYAGLLEESGWHGDHKPPLPPLQSLYEFQSIL